MLVTEGGITMLVNKVHPSKAPVPMLVTEGGITMLVNLLHPLKANFSMVVTDDGVGNTTLSNKVHS